MQPTHLDLFSGIGGFSLAFESEGFRTIGFCEIDPYASAVLKKHWPSVTNYGDVRKAIGVQCDVVTGGFPCQPFSVAGKRAGKADDRYLWPAMLDVISASGAAWVLGENVSGIVAMALDTCLSDLEAIGYACQAFAVPACAVGSFQHRERVWICAHSERKGRKGCQSIHGTSSSTEATHAKLGNGMPDSWDALARHSGGIRGGDGLSVAMVRRELKSYGNSIVPQVARTFARAIREADNAATLKP